MKDLIMTEDFPKYQTEFNRRFNTEEACRQYLFNLRWPHGFICPNCRHDKAWHSATGLLICTRCEHQHSLTAYNQKTYFSAPSGMLSLAVLSFATCDNPQ